MDTNMRDNKTLTLSIKDIALIKNHPQECYEHLLKKSYSHKPHLGSLPYDLNTNDPDKLKERLDAIDERLKKTDDKIKKTEEELDSLLGDKKEKINQTIEDAEKQISNGKDTINRWGSYYNRSMGQAIDDFDEYFDAMDRQKIDVYPRSEYDDAYDYAMDDLITISNALDYARTSSLWMMKDPEREETFDECLKNMKEANNAFKDYMDLCDKYDVDMEESGWLKRDMFDDGIEYLEYLNDAQQKIDKNTKIIEEQKELLNNIDESSATNPKRVTNLQNKLDKLQREKQDYLKEKDRTQNKMDGIKK